MKITVSQHAIDEAIRDFRLDRRIAEEWIRSNVKKALFIANIVGDDGKPSRLFAYQRAAFILADTEDYVITVYRREHANTDLYRRVQTLVGRELSRYERKERATERRVRVEKARLEIEKAECRWRMEMTPSAKVISANTRRIAQIDEKIARLDAELMAARKEKSAIAKSVVMFV